MIIVISFLGLFGLAIVADVATDFALSGLIAAWADEFGNWIRSLTPNSIRNRRKKDKP